MLIVSQALLWTAVIVLSVAVAALARQIGVLHERIAPVGALAISQGPQPGEAAPKLTVETLAGPSAKIGGARETLRSQLLFFVSPTCPICKQLLPTVLRFANAEKMDLLVLGDGDEAQHRQMADRFKIDTRQFAISTEVGQTYRVGKLPYAVLIDDRGTIVAQGLVNTREHLESLTNVQETGFKSVQDYLVSRRTSQQESADNG
ncbi:methylamine dehydrogenase accessory protein MauD [uncultured Caulobacter sp.]|uniref:methylamine dehydrogenase accessory protein MauD n=1 Tax=uncultured Caulobacter sp. TaxID=158749 RepID=UPI00260179D2|nr:methylamine dehydrogenase accessory protein MauD [uncultured Caulobacter sp.]